MNYIYKKWWAQLILWLFVFIMFFSLIKYFQGYKFTIIASAFNTLVLYIAHLISVKFLIPLYKKDTPRYFLITPLALVLLTVITTLFEVSIIDKLRVISHDSPPAFYHYLRQMIMISFVIFIDIAVSLMEDNNKLVESEKTLTEEKLQTELKLLKAQINPHFIFNTLNNIYSLTYMQSPKAPESVLKLSEMLRYVFYDCSKDRVAISGELQYIENFIAFQKMKSEEGQNITLDNKLANKNIEVAPMLLIPFIENAFKYSRIEENKDASVAISIEQNDDVLEFSIRNSVPLQNKPLSGSGMGIKNVQHRLNIIYANQHDLSITETEQEFEVILKLHTS